MKRQNVMDVWEGEYDGVMDNDQALFKQRNVANDLIVGFVHAVASKPRT